MARYGQREGVMFVGKAQEKASVVRTERRRSGNGGTYPWLVKSTAMVNQDYFYIQDADFGPFFLKFCRYFPYNAKLCINGHEYVKRQLRKQGIAFEALDNGVRSCADPQRLQALCDGLGAANIDALLRKWQARLPHPFSAADPCAGCRYDVSILQAEFSLTQVLDQPVNGRIFFEEVIRENLDLGRPSQVPLIFDRRINRRTPGRFRARVVTDGVVPSLHVDYKRSRIKPYHKEGRALRTETTINDTATVGFVLQPRGFTRAQLRERMGTLCGQSVAPGRMTYDLRRPRLHGLIRREPHSHRYRLTDTGLRTALFWTRSYARLLRTGMAELDPHAIAHGKLRQAFDRFSATLENTVHELKLAS